MSNLRSVLQGIYESRGTLTPAVVVDEAREAEHPLHSRFEWDNDVAGERYRLHQAGQLIRSVKIQYGTDGSGKQKAVREWVSFNRPADDVDDDPTRAYHPTADALEDPFTRRLILAEFDREWKAFRARYQHLKEFAETILRDVTDVAS